MRQSLASPRLETLDAATTERVLLALKVLTSSLDPAEGNATQEEIDELRLHLGDEADGLLNDEIACLVIQREIKRQEETMSRAAAAF